MLRCGVTVVTLLLLLVILFAATLIRSAFGFGEALIAVPLLVFLMPVEVAVPLAMLVSITVAAVVVWQDWRQIHFRSATRLVLASLVGIPLGLFALTSAPEALLKGVLGLIISVFAAFSLLQRAPALIHDRHAWAFGFAAGALGGAYGMNGPPLVVFGSLRRWSPQHFRATLQGYFLPVSSATMFAYAFTGLWTPTVTRYYLISLPVVFAAIFAGRWLNARLERAGFLRLVHVALLLVGLILLLQALVL